MKIIETELEKAMVERIKTVLLELGNGFSFVGNQYKISVDDKDYFIDLLFYHTKLHCYIVVELKNTEYKPEYAGKLNFYLSAVDDLVKTDADNPTIGILLCSETDEDIAKYSILKGNEHLFASKYRLCLPTEEQLRAEIEAQKEIFYMQHPELDENKNE